MPYLFSLIYYLITVLIHALLYRFHSRKRFFRKTLLVFSTGILIVFWLQNNNPFTYSATLLYLLLIGLHLVFFTSPLLGDEGPSAKINFLLDKKGKMSRNQLINSFSDDDLIVKRLREMEGRLIFRKTGKYFLSDRGKKLIKLVNRYRRLMAWGDWG